MNGTAQALLNTSKNRNCSTDQARVNTHYSMTVEEEIIDTKPVAKFLGIKNNSELNFSLHIKLTADKVAVRKLNQLMAITRKP